MKEKNKDGLYYTLRGTFVLGMPFVVRGLSNVVINYTAHRSSTTVGEATRKGLANYLSQSS